MKLHFTSIESEIWADLGPEMADLRPVKAYLRLKGLNQLLKDNMWSAIPVALLCMIVNWSERKQGSGPEGDEVL